MAVQALTWLLGTLATTAAIVVLLIATIPLFLHLERVNALLLQHVESRLGHRVEAGAISLRLVPQVAIELSNVVVLPATEGPPIFSAHRLALAIRPSALLDRKVTADRLTIERPTVTMRYDESTGWRLSSADSPADGNKGNPLGVLMLVHEVSLSDGQVVVIDETRKHGPGIVEITGLQGTIARSTETGRVELQLSGALPAAFGQGAFNFVGTLTQLAELTAAAHDGPPRSADVFRLDGIVRAVNVDLVTFAEVMGIQDEHPISASPIDVNIHLGFISTAAGVEVIIPNWTITSAELALSGAFSMAGRMASSFQFSVFVASSPITLETLQRHVPLGLVSRELATLVSEHDPGGTAELIRVTVRGNTSPPHLAVSAEIEVSDGHLRLRENGPIVQNLSGRLFVEPAYVRVEELRGTYGSMRVTDGRVRVASLDETPVLDLVVTGELPAADLDGLLVATVPSLTLPDMASGLEGPEGVFGFTVRAGGPVGGGRPIQVQEAEILVTDVTFRRRELPFPLEHINGRLTFTGESMRIEELAAHWGPLQLGVHGLVSVGNAPTYRGLTIEASGDAGALAERLALAGPASGLTLSGPVRLDARLTGALQAPLVEGRLELKEMTARIPEILTKPGGTPTAIDFAAAVLPDAAIRVDRLDLVLPAARVAAGGRIQPTQDWAFDAHVATGTVNLDSLVEMVSLGPLHGGTLQTLLHAKGKGLDWRTWDASGWLRLDHGRLAPPGVKGEAEDVTLRVRVERNQIDLEQASARINNSDVRVSGTINRWKHNPDITLVLQSSELDLGLPTFEKKTDGSAPPGAFQNWLASGTLAATLLVDYAYYDRFLFTGLSCRLTLDHGVLHVERLSGDTDDGHLDSSLSIALDGHEPSPLEAAVRVTGVPVQRLFSVLSKNKAEDPIKGWLSFEGKLQAERDATSLQWHTLTSKRDFHLLIEEGQILHVPLLSRLLKILNIPALLQGQVDLTKAGLPFNRMVGIFSLANGVVLVEEFFIDSPVLKISAAGQYNIVTDHLDLALATSPLGSYAEALKRIPLFGKLFAGDRQGLDTALFSVKGPLNDPEVTYLPVASLATGVTGVARFAFDVLVNAITFPKEVLSVGEQLFAPEGERP